MRAVDPTGITPIVLDPYSTASARYPPSPIKVLLDLIYLQPGGDSPLYLQELRLQNAEGLDLDALACLADLAGSPKLRRAGKLGM